MSHLKLISFTSDNFDIGAVLTYADKTAINDSIRINEILSLYFQWTDKAYTLARIGSSVVRELTIDYDRADLEPEYLSVRISDHLNTIPGSNIEIHFEIFSIAYSFSSKAEELLIDTDGSAILYFKRPNILHTAKSRSAPRRILDSQASFTVILHSNRNSSISCNLLEIGPRAICISGVLPNNHTSYNVEIRGETFEFETLRTCENKTILTLNTSSTADYIRYFKAYAHFAYPHLEEKNQSNLEQVFQMYVDSGFYGKGQTANTGSTDFETTKLKTIETWKGLQTNNGNVIEMVAKDDQGKAIGSSCLAKAFHHEKEDFWVIHHLAVLTNPSAIHRTTDLYLWRIDFLLGLNEQFSVCCWYDSTSKWIDRIWTKFHRTCLAESAYVHEIETYTFQLNEHLSTPDEPGELVDFSVRNFGLFKRYICSSNTYFGGVGPELLNASGFLNHFCFYEKPPSENELLRLHSQIGALNPQGNTKYRLTVPKGTKLRALENRTKSNADRFCIFPNTSLPYLLSSLMHSLAVMERKHAITNRQTA